MKRLLIIGVSALLLGAFCVPLSKAQDSIEGDWVGGTNLFDNPVFVHVRFTSNSSGISGLANVQPWKVGNRPLIVVKVEARASISSFRLSRAFLTRVRVI